MDENIIQNGDFVFIVLDPRRRWLAQAKSGEEFHTHRGIIYFDDIIGKSYGICTFSHPHDSQGYKFYILKPLPSDFILHMSRKTQIIYPQDAGLILLYGGIGPGSKVLEAGTGSGALTCILGSYVRPNGHIYSYDIRDKSLKQARRNVKNARLDDVITIRKGNIVDDKLNHKNIDAVVLDMPIPWVAIRKVKDYLKLSGCIVSFSPTIEQVKKTTFALEEHEFFEIKTVELLLRDMQIKRSATRPDSRMVGHSGYLTFARKIRNRENPYRAIKPQKPEFVEMDGMPLRRDSDD
ncbi:MAG: methyltransferase domain-containing protein [Candidatus Lokiarchaeota archaeon]|nr:methyltransferase domain-containing protein [Candidatus Lokiarchaeota archaeon]